MLPKWATVSLREELIDKKDGCHYGTGSKIAERRVNFAKNYLLSDLGIELDRLEMFFVPRIETNKFVEATNLMFDRFKKLDPLKFNTTKLNWLFVNLRLCYVSR